MSRRPLLSLGLDLDNLWSYMKIHGDRGWEAHPSYLEPLAPLIIETLRRHGVRATIFVVGQDAALEKNAAALRALADAGHEIGNHSFLHEPWLHLYSRPQIEDELRSRYYLAFNSNRKEEATGFRPIEVKVRKGKARTARGYYP